MLSLFRKKFQPAIPHGQRVYAIGDVHGRADLLDKLLETIREDDARRCEAETTLICLGDLIDRGPDSRAVLNRIRAGVGWARMIALMGNHESILNDLLDGRTEALTPWLRLGGAETAQSWGIPEELISSSLSSGATVNALRHAISTEERAWLKGLQTSLQVGDYYFVHAGVRPSVALEQQTDHDRLWIRNDFLRSSRNHGAVIVHGHTISRHAEQKRNRIGIDTGAYITGKLTAVGLHEKESWFLSTDED